MLNIWWDSRGLIMASVKHEFKSQYSKSILGSLWLVMNPLYMCIIYTVIFSSFMNVGNNKHSYTIYVAAGLLAWNLFIDILNRSLSIYLNYANIIKQQKFPLLCLPMVVLSISWIDFSISFGLFTAYLVFINEFPGWCYLALIPIFLLQTVFAAGLGTVLGIFNIFFRDIGKALVVLLQIWFWMTPIVYFVDKLPINMQSLLKYNPLTSIMSAYQTILVKQQWPDWGSLLLPLAASILIGLFFLGFYHRHSADILDEL